MKTGIIIFVIILIALPFVYKYCEKRVSEGDLFASNTDESFVVYVKEVRGNDVYYRSSNNIQCMKKKEFLKKFHKVHYYV